MPDAAVAGRPGRILVVACGGTISSIRSGAGATPRLTAAQLVADLPQVSDIGPVDAQTFSTLPSAHASLEDVLRLHEEIESWVATRNDAGGVVVTHGTDTLEEVAFALELLWRHPIPIVVTGALRSASLPSPDGRENLLGAAATAGAAGARGLGVLVVLNDQIHAARFVRKTHTSNLGAFQSPAIGPIGYIAEGKARIVFRPAWREPLQERPSKVSDFPVALIKMSIGDDGRLFQHLLPSGYRGVVIEAFGGGHMTREIVESRTFQRVVDSVPVVLASRVGAGESLRSTYAFAGCETDLIDRGLISSGVLDGLKSRVLLTLLLAAGADRDGVRRAFARQGLYAGEL